MRNPAWIVFFLLLSAVAARTAAGNTEPGQPPNVLLIIVDDWGYADLGVHGIKRDVRTPNLDRLARSGVFFTEGYVTAPQCSPSRAALLTGRYQQRFGFYSIVDGPLPLGEKTIGDYFKHNGYHTGYVGKWHLSPNEATVKWNEDHLPGWKPGEPFNPPAEALAPYQPWARGFDWCMVGEERVYESTTGGSGPRDRRVVNKRTTTEDRILFQTSAALEFLGECGSEQPFLLCLSYYAPHVPMEAPEEFLARFPGEMPERRRYALAMMAAVDDGVGKIWSALEKNGRADNTLMFFVSDNGAPLKRTKPDAPISYRLGAWNGSLNDPLNGEKGMLSEGGIRVPFFLVWPGGVPARGAFSAPVSALDIVPTALAAAHLHQPDGLDGKNLLPALASKEADEDDVHHFMAWRIWSQSAVRSGKWKLLRWGGGEDMLFDLSTDPEESHDVVLERPETAARLKNLLHDWLEMMPPATLARQPATESEQRWYSFFFGR